MANYCDNKIIVFTTESEWKEITKGLESNAIQWEPSVDEFNEYEHIFICCSKWSPTPWTDGHMEKLSEKYPCTVFKYSYEVEEYNDGITDIWFANGETLSKESAKKNLKKMRDEECKRFLSNTNKISKGVMHTVAIMPNEKVAFEGTNTFGECNVLDWEEIKQISAGNWHTVGIKNDGSLVACGSNTNGQCNVEDIKNAIQVSCGRYHTAVLLADGRVEVRGKVEEKFQETIIGNRTWKKNITYPLFVEIEGTGYANRNDHIEHMVPGETLKLVEDRKSKFYDPVAIEVFNDRDETVGFLKDSYDKQLLAIAKNIKNIRASVVDVTHVSKRRKGSKYSLMTVKLEEVKNSEGKFVNCSYKQWKDIVKICSIYDAVIGLTSDGKILYDGYYGELKDKDIEKVFKT